MKTKTPTGRTPRPRASTKGKAEPRQAPLPNVQGEAETEGEAAAPPKQTLKIPEVLAELETIAKPLNVRVTYEAIGGELGAGGLCKVKGLWRVIIDKRTTPSERVSVLAPALARFDFSSVPLSPQVRELLSRVAPAPVTPPATEEATAAANTTDAAADAATADATDAESSNADASTADTAPADATDAESSEAAPADRSAAPVRDDSGAAAGAS